MKKRFVSLIIGVLSLSTLTGCGGGDDPAPAPKKATINNLSENATHGTVSGFNESLTYDVGDTVTFTVEPDEYFNIGKVVFNGEELEEKRSEGSKHFYSAIAKAGENKVSASFDVDPDINFVEKFDLDISDDIYQYIMECEESTEDKPGTLDNPDFRRDGIERVRAPIYYDEEKGDYAGKADDDDFFFNCVDGDTTHVETFNLKYTVKIRYLMDDTQESTSQMEEWGLSGSYFSKYVFWGEFGKENKKDAHYDEKMTELYDSFEIQRLVGGATHIILVSKPLAYAGASATLEEIQEAKGKDPDFKGKYGSTTDGNQRDLAFVWYAKSKEKIPDKSEFRCLNLELIYEGFSENTGSAEAYGDYYYKYFDAANMSAQVNKRHMHSEERDPFYFYYVDEDVEVPTLPLSRIYTDDAPLDDIIGYLPSSDRCDKMRLWAFEGYVSRKVGGAFYIQDKPSYTEEEIAKIKSGDKKRDVGFGIYVFTYSQTPIDEGQHVRVIGALSSYGGTFQVQGISYTAYDPNPKRNTVILDYNADGSIKYYDIVPIKLSVEEFHKYQLPQVLVQITDNVYFNQFTVDQSSFEPDEPLVDVCEGGKYEVNRYNKDFYKFYNVYNSLTLFARYGEVDNTPSEIETIHGGDAMRKSNQFLRIVVNSEVLVTYRGEDAFSYKFFTGGSYEYHPRGPQYIGQEGTVTIEHTRKKCQATDGDGIIGISKGYISTTYKTFKMEIEVVDAYDVTHCLKKADVQR